MARTYKQLSLEERCKIAGLRAEGRTLKEIAADLDRSPSCISRKLNRNSGTKLGYQPAFAAEQAKTPTLERFKARPQPKAP